MTAAFPIETACACGAHLSGTCPDDYRRELEPADETVAELQSVVVAMRHRGDSDELVDLEETLTLYLGQLQHVQYTRAAARDDESRRVQCIRLAMAIAAVAVRYRERIDQRR